MLSATSAIQKLFHLTDKFDFRFEAGHTFHIGGSFFLFSNVHFMQFNGVGRAETPGGLGVKKAGFSIGGRDGVGRAGTLGLGCGKYF